MIKGVIFDMDGLLVDSERLTYRLIKEELNTQGLDMTEEFYKSLLGRTRETAHALFINQYGEDFDDYTLTSIINQKLLDQYNVGNIDVKEGVLNLLKYLKENHIKTIVASSSPRETVIKCLTGCHLIQYFDDFICGDEVNIGKPDPEIFIKACHKLGCLKNEAIIFEDSEAGILAGYNANINVICIPDMKYPEPNYAKKTYKIFNTIDEAIPYIK